MRMRSCTVALCVLVWGQTGGASAQGRVMTLSEVLARAREQAPQVLAARLAVDESRGRLVGASARFTSNPEVAAAVGNRDSVLNRFTDFELAVNQQLEPGARRSARLAGANAAIAQSSARVDEVTRRVLRTAAVAYYRVVHANGRVRLLAASQELAASVHAAADRRFRAGDIAVLDVNLARVALARVKADREAAQASRALALGELRGLLRTEVEIAVDTIVLPAPVEPGAALRSALDRPELRALEAAIQEADAEVRLGQTYAKPEYGLGARYSREEGDQVVLGGLTITLPMFSSGQEQRATGSARAARLRAELDAARAQVDTDLRAMLDAYARRLAAVSVLEAEAVPGLDENERLTTRSFEAGQIGLADLLLIRREILDTRFAHLDALLEAALARVDVDAAAGVLQ